MRGPDSVYWMDDSPVRTAAPTAAVVLTLFGSHSRQYATSPFSTACRHIVLCCIARLHYGLSQIERNRVYLLYISSQQARPPINCYQLTACITARPFNSTGRCSHSDTNQTTLSSTGYQHNKQKQQDTVPHALPEATYRQLTRTPMVGLRD